jgi:hypothetical protein
MSTQVTEQVSRLAVRRRSARRSFGLSGPEVGAAIIALLAFVIALYYYLTALSPEQSRLRTQEQTLQRINAELAATGTTPTGPSGPNAKDALASLETFKSEYLKPLSSGRIALLNEVNALAKKHSVTLTSGIDMPLQKGAKSDEADSKRKKKTEEVLNAFPHLDVHFTVFGQYQDLRAFINELERNKQFLVMKTISLQLQEDKGGGGGGGRSRGRASLGSGLVLGVEASVYFQP